MEEQMDRGRDSLIKKSAIAQEREIWQWTEKLAKFEGTGRRSLKYRPNKTIRLSQRNSIGGE
jgi:hypothetical protein